MLLHRSRCCFAVLLFCIFTYVIFGSLHHDLTTTVKFQSTDLAVHTNSEILTRLPLSSSICPEHFVRRQSADGLRIDDRYLFERQLSSGFEGQANIYLDLQTQEHVVIKSFFTATSPARNTVPPTLQDHFEMKRWPTEIPFMLLSNGSPDPDFAEMLDYFVLENGGMREWQLVTPFYQHGTLAKAGKRIGEQVGLPSNMTITDLDRVFRPSFERLLKSLAQLHHSGYCHDDIKPANIFISNKDPLTWILGDFGQIRERNHPYHSSYIWRKQVQLRDCALNDTRRLLKVYLDFLRSFEKDTSTFDSKFLRGRENWSRLFWQYMQYPTDATTLRINSKRVFCAGCSSVEKEPAFIGLPPKYMPARFIMTKSLAERFLVSHELECSLHASRRRWFEWILLFRS